MDYVKVAVIFTTRIQSAIWPIIGSVDNSAFHSLQVI